MSTDCCNPYSGSGSGGGGGGGTPGPTWFSFGIEGPIGAGPPGNFTYYAYPGGPGPAAMDEQFAVAMTGFTITAMQVYLLDAFMSVGASLTITLRINSVDTALQIVLGPGSNSAIAVATVPILASEFYSISIVGVGVDDYPDNLLGQIYYTT